MTVTSAEEQREQSQVEQDLEELRIDLKKIIQAYRIRLQCLRKRHEVLTELERVAEDKGFNDIPNFKRTVRTGWDKKKGGFRSVLKNGDAFYSILDTNLKKERLVLEIARRKEIDDESNIINVIKNLEQYKAKFGGLMNDVVREINIKKGYRFSLGDIDRFLRHIISFLNLMQEDILIIERRMLKEERFLKGKDLKSFNSFILAWEDEMKSNEILVKHFRKVLESNRKVIKFGQREGNLIMAGGAVGGLVGIFGTLVAGTGPIGPIVAGAYGVIFLTVGFLQYTNSVFNEELISVYKDEKLLERLEEIRAIKKPFWKKIFG